MPFFYTIPQNHAALVKRLGKHARLQRDGLCFKIPLIETLKEVTEWGDVANKRGCYIELSEQQTDTPSRQCQTKDNVTIGANASIYWKIVDPVKAVYEVDVLPRSLSDIALNALRSNIGKMNLDQILSERQTLNEKIADQLSEKEEAWGIVLKGVEIQEIDYSSETAEAMRQEMTAERKKRAEIAEAQGQAEAEVAKAEAEAKAIKIRAEAQAEATKVMAEAEKEYIQRLKEHATSEVAGNIIMSQKYIEGMQTISKHPSNKVFLPNSFNGLFNIPTDNGEEGNKGSEG